MRKSVLATVLVLILLPQPPLPARGQAMEILRKQVQRI